MADVIIKNLGGDTLSLNAPLTCIIGGGETRTLSGVDPTAVANNPALVRLIQQHRIGLTWINDANSARLGSSTLTPNVLARLLCGDGITPVPGYLRAGLAYRLVMDVDIYYSGPLDTDVFVNGRACAFTMTSSSNGTPTELEIALPVDIALGVGNIKVLVGGQQVAWATVTVQPAVGFLPST